MRVPSESSPSATGWRSPQAGMLLVVLFWGANFSALKLAFTQIEPLGLTAFRFLFGTMVMAVLVQRIEGSLAVPRSAIMPLVVLGLLGNTLYQLAFVEGLARTTATSSSLILASMPVMVTLFAGVLGIEAVTRRQVIAVLIAFAGVVVVVAARGFTGTGAQSHVGDFIMMFAVVLWTAYTLLMRRFPLQGISSLKITTWTLFTGTPGLVLAGLPALGRTNWSAMTWAGWGGIIYSALLSLVAAYLLFNRGVRLLGASSAAVYTSLTPLVAAGIAIVALGERPTLVHAVGGAMIIVGVLSARKPATARAAPTDDAVGEAEVHCAE